MVERHAVRILFILYFCRENGGNVLQRSLFEDELPTDAYLESETKLQKFDFWVRYPDYLAAALLQRCAQGDLSEEKKKSVKQVIRQILHDEEPVLRNIPMRRYLRGAHEPLDDVVSFLSSRNLAYKRILEKGQRICYYITLKGLQTVENLARDCSEATWYADRCKLLNQFFGHMSGNELRTIQYLEEEYKDTPLNQTIANIESEVRHRFEHIFQEPL